MSVQLVAPHSVAIKAMNKISVRSCRALLARGSGSSSKHSANRVIGRSFRIKSYLQNQFLTASQQLTKSHMRFPCPPGEGKSRFNLSHHAHFRSSTLVWFSTSSEI